MQFVSDCVTSVACPETSQQYHLWGLDQKKVWSSTKSVKLNKIVDTIFGPLLMFHKFKYYPIIADILNFSYATWRGRNTAHAEGSMWFGGD